MDNSTPTNNLPLQTSGAAEIEADLKTDLAVVKPHPEIGIFFLILLLVCLVEGALLVNTRLHFVKVPFLTPEVAEKIETKEPAVVSTEELQKVPPVATYSGSLLITLPQPKLTGTKSVNDALATRRSRRTFSDEPITLAELSQMLWAGQGITVPEDGKRTAPSAYEVFPYTLYVVVRNVEGLAPGAYEYLPSLNALGDRQQPDAGAALTAAGVQPAAQKAPVVIVQSVAFGKGFKAMKEGAKDAALIEGGHIGQNLYLEAESLKLGMVTMAGFDVAKLQAALKLDLAATPMYVIPVGHRSATEP